MEAGGKDSEEETLQTAFKKLRVDAETLSGAASVSDPLTPRAASRVSLDGSSGAKAKLSGPKDTWHCCSRKSSRGTSSRSQRRRRSKSPILHPPRFTYCSSAAPAPPGGSLKQQRLAVCELSEPPPAAPDQVPASPAVPPVPAERRSPGVPAVVFGVRPSYIARTGGAGSSPPEVATVATSARREAGSSGEGKGSTDGAAAAAPLRSDATDFRALSELHSRRSAEVPPAACRCSEESERCGCRSHAGGWNGVEVYSFTGLRSAIQEDESRTVNASSSSSPLSGGSPRSCSEQARAYVDDITIEDLSGYMEYYLYIPKKMSHMAEMMYT